jgi:hypothetical protein
MDSPQKYGNPRYTNDQGLCVTDESGQLIKDETGQYLPADPKTGAPKVATERCPTCKGSGRVVKR